MGASIVVPTLSEYDDRCVLRRWLHPHGAALTAAGPVAVLETAKASFELEAPGAGHLKWLVPEGEEVAFGAAVAELVEEPSAVGAPPAPVPPAPASSLRRQQTIARVVQRSQREVPWAFGVMKVAVDDALEWLRQASAQGGVVVGLPELALKALGASAKKAPKFYGLDAKAASADPVDLSVTVDAGRGVVMALVQGCARATLPAIGRRLMECRVKAMRDNFKGEDLRPGRLSLSINMEPGMIFAIPLVYPGQVAMLSLGAPAAEPAFGPGGAVVSKTFVHLGLAYDHAVVNGSDAMQLLKLVRRFFEKPAEAMAELEAPVESR